MAENKARIEVEVDTSSVAGGLRDTAEAVKKSLGSLDWKQIGLGFIAGGGFDVAVRLFSSYVSMVSEAVDQTVELKRALASWDVGDVTRNLGQVTKEMDRLAELSERLRQPGLHRLGTLFLLGKEAISEKMAEQTLGQRQDAIQARLDTVVAIQEARRQTALLLQGAERDIQALGLRQQQELRKGNLEAVRDLQAQIAAQRSAAEDLARLQLAGTQGKDLSAAIEKGIKGEGLIQIQRTQALARANQEQEFANKRAQDALRVERMLAAGEAERLAVENQRAQLTARRETDEAQFAANEVKRQSDRKVAALSAAEAVMDAERGLARTRAEVEGRLLDDSQAVAAERLRITQESARAQTAAVEAETAASLRGLVARREATQQELQNLGGLAGVLSGPEFTRRREALLADLEDTQRRIEDVAKAGADRRARIAEDEAARERQIRLRQAQEAMAFLQAQLQQEMALRQAVTGTQTILGQRTSAQNIQEQMAFGQALPAGSVQQAQALQQGAQMLAAQQGESRGAFGSILGATGLRRGSLIDVQTKFAEQQMKARQMVADFQMGGSVNLRKLSQAMQMLPLGEQVTRLGGVGAIFGQAVTPLGQQFAAAGGGGPFADLAAGADRSLAALEEAFRASFRRINKTVEDAAQSWVTSVESVAPDMASILERELVRSLELGRAKR